MSLYVHSFKVDFCLCFFGGWSVDFHHICLRKRLHILRYVEDGDNCLVVTSCPMAAYAQASCFVRMSIAKGDGRIN